MAPSLLELCEDFVVHQPPRLNANYVHTDRFVFVPRGPGGGSLAMRIRLGGGDVADAVEEVRALAREHESQKVVWWVGDLATPAGVFEELQQLGLAPDPDEPWLASLAITRPPEAAGSADVVAVETLDDFLTAQNIDLVTAGVPADERERLLEGNRSYWEEFRTEEIFRLFLARLDGEAVGFARSRIGPLAAALIGGGVLEHARGRGVYRALVRARWQDAVDRGASALFTQANHFSRPILERLGFERLGTIRLLVDRL